MADFSKELDAYMDKAIKKCNEIIENITNKSKDVADVTKLKSDIKTEEHLIKAYKAVIGEYVAAHDEILSDDEIVADQRERIKEALRKIADYNEKIEILKNKDIKK